MFCEKNVIEVMGISKLLEWSRQNGAIVSSKLEFVQFSKANIGATYREGTETTENLDNNHIRLPLKLAITRRAALDSFGEGFVEIASKTSNTNSVLVLYLARERSKGFLPNSFYEPYISLLPDLMDINSPYTWSPEDKECIKGTNLGSSLKENLASLVEQWWEIINLLPETVEKPQEHFVNMKFYYEFKFHEDKDLFEYFSNNQRDNWTSFPNYLWGSLMLKSRSFPAYLMKSVDDSDIKQDEVMLLPIIDLLNHNPKSDVEWSVNNTSGTNYFNFKTNSAEDGMEVFNNYGRKGNEELLLAYGFCIENNESDTTALKIKVPVEMLPELESNGVKLPKIEDYTTSVFRTNSLSGSKGDYSEYEEGLLFFINEKSIPDNLVLLFQFLVKNKWEDKLSLRMKLAGLNHLRQAIETKVGLIENCQSPKTSSPNFRNITIYVAAQKRILNATIKNLKRLEKSILTDPQAKENLLTLKSVYKKDKRFSNALLVSLGITSYEQLIQNNFQDQTWLLYLIRCHNRKVYDEEDDTYLPEWVYDAFERISKETPISPKEVLQFKELYESLVIPLTTTAPEVFNRGVWTVEELIWSAKLLDTLSFIRGKEQECIVVRP